MTAFESPGRMVSNLISAVEFKLNEFKLNQDKLVLTVEERSGASGC